MALWIALAVSLVAVTAATAYVVVRGIRLWRDAKRSSAAIGAATARISDASLGIERQIAAMNAASERLRAAVARLGESRAQLDVQRAALREARSQVRQTFWFVPGL